MRFRNTSLSISYFHWFGVFVPLPKWNLIFLSIINSQLQSTISKCFIFYSYRSTIPTTSDKQGFKSIWYVIFQQCRSSPSNFTLFLEPNTIRILILQEQLQLGFKSKTNGVKRSLHKFSSRLISKSHCHFRC